MDGTEMALYAMSVCEGGRPLYAIGSKKRLAYLDGARVLVGGKARGVVVCPGENALYVLDGNGGNGYAARLEYVATHKEYPHGDENSDGTVNSGVEVPGAWKISHHVRMGDNAPDAVTLTTLGDGPVALYPDSTALALGKKAARLVLVEMDDDGGAVVNVSDDGGAPVAFTFSGGAWSAGNGSATSGDATSGDTTSGDTTSGDESNKETAA